MKPTTVIAITTLAALTAGAAWLARRYHHRRTRRAVRALHAASIDRLTDDEVAALVDDWRDPDRPLGAELVAEIYGIGVAA